MALGSRPTTADELLQLPRDNWRYELVRGELRRMTPSGYTHGKVAMRVAARLAPFVEENQLGETFAAETGFLISRDPDTVRAPDAAFVTAARLPGSGGSGDGFFSGPPDLAVEVISPSDASRDVQEKVAEWLEAGTLAVLLIDARRKLATLYRPRTAMVSYQTPARISIPDLLPGWSLALTDIFDI